MNRIPTRQPLTVRIFNWWRYDLEYWLAPIGGVTLVLAWIISIIVTVS